MNRIISVLLLTCFFSTVVFSQQLEQRRRSIVEIIDQEIKEIDRLLKQYKSKNPDLMFRKSDLHLEKGRIFKEEENNNYLSLDPAVRSKTKKENYFKKSYKEFVKAKSLSTTIVKKFPKYQRSADVLYIIGFYEKEFGSYDKALNFFKEAESKALTKSESEVRIQNALAEIYYNQKDYKKAVFYYEKNLKLTHDRWWTKDAYNLSWSYFRTQRVDDAINLMKKVYLLSEKEKYVDMRVDSRRDLGIFFAESGRIDEAMAFFKGKSQEYASELSGIAAALKQQGKYPQALEVYNQALKYEKNKDNQVVIYLARLDLFDRYEKHDYHLKDSQDFLSLMKQTNVNQEQRDLYSFQIKKQISKLQSQLGHKAYQTSEQLRKLKSRQINEYLNIQKVLEPNKLAENSFYKAETFYQARDYQAAAENYLIALDTAKQSNDQKIGKLASEGLLASVGQSEQAFPQQKKYYLKAYENYLKWDQSSSKAKEVYKRLFKYHLEENDSTQMKLTLDEFAIKFPGTNDDQEKMVNSLVKNYSDKKDMNNISLILNDINQNKYSLSSKAKENLFEVFQKYEIKKIETLLSKGDTLSAKNGYFGVFNNSRSSNVAKANAAYNLMVINYQNFEVQPTYDWSVKSIQLMENADFLKFSNSFLSVSKYLFERLQFKASADIAHRSLMKSCSQKNNVKNLFFNNALYAYKLDGEDRKLSEFGKLSQNCDISNSSKVIYFNELMDYYLAKNNSTRIEALLSEVKVIPLSILDRYIWGAFELYKKHRFDKSKKKSTYWKTQVMDLYSKNIKRSNELLTKSLDCVAFLRNIELEQLYTELQRVKLRFPEKVYNVALKEKFTQLDNLQNKALEVQRIGSGLGIIKSYDLLLSGYKNVIDSIDNFYPQAKSLDYVNSFRDGMKKISEPLKIKMNDLIVKSQAVHQGQEIMGYSDSNLPYKNFGAILEDFKLIPQERAGTIQ